MSRFGGIAGKSSARRSRMRTESARRVTMYPSRGGPGAPADAVWVAGGSGSDMRKAAAQGAPDGHPGGPGEKRPGREGGAMSSVGESSAGSVLTETLNGATGDYAVSGDAMRW